MPTIKQSMIDTSKLGPELPAPSAMPAMGAVAADPTRSPFMTSPMPVNASGSDSLRRQFYNNGVGVSQIRLLPVQIRRAK